ncbi:DUF4861 family protein [Autumnicola edwardsiae]|uniref:DUF4861 family protein n=1 Tax=Autumnicola edwardsiae TaxID=3075594 RepID=A0ABU3CXS8_9FLAO|nr:DUF4861 family protein [Zunongwangia sp. F297]MDT0651043.1 DUF4861 family protein [Zunongwangia sp. F297]
MKILTGFRYLGLVFSFLLFTNCKKADSSEKVLTFEVKNELNFFRNEIVAINIEDLQGMLEDVPKENIRVVKESDGEVIRNQWIDNDQDGELDEMLFLANIDANSTLKYLIVNESTLNVPENNAIAFSRFVPERLDDYAWENDKVAFRTYGPSGQREAMEGVPGSTMSSGIDIWLKRTEKPVINKWYEHNLKSPGYYHEDHGEGYDPYHVGQSRGTGGIGVWENDSLLVSQNFTNHRTIAKGPLRTVFELDYGPWSKYEISETKRISLDLGSNFSKFQISFKTDKEVPNYAVGITLHQNAGETKIGGDGQWVRHWEKIDDAYVGQGIVINPENLDSAFVKISDAPDQSHLLVLASAADTLEYYAGFAWEKSGNISSAEEWDRQLQRQVEINRNPLVVTLGEVELVSNSNSNSNSNVE